MKVYLICDSYDLEEEGKINIKYAFANEQKAKETYDFLKSCFKSDSGDFDPIMVEHEINNNVPVKFHEVRAEVLWIEETDEIKYDSYVVDATREYPTMVYTSRNLLWDCGYKIRQRNKKKVKQWEFSVEKTFSDEGFNEQEAIKETIQILSDFIDRVLQKKGDNLTTEEAINKVTDELYPRKIIDQERTFTGNRIWNELEDIMDEVDVNEDLHGLHDD